MLYVVEVEENIITSNITNDKTVILRGSKEFESTLVIFILILVIGDFWLNYRLLLTISHSRVQENVSLWLILLEDLAINKSWLSYLTTMAAETVIHFTLFVIFLNK